MEILPGRILGIFALRAPALRARVARPRVYGSDYGP